MVLFLGVEVLEGTEVLQIQGLAEVEALEVLPYM
jgi:hypothetical protein